MPASWAGAQFHVDIDAEMGGRRNATHEYPKKDTPWTEDMGRSALRWNVTGYCICSPLVPDYTIARDALRKALQLEGPQTLQHPSYGSVQANCDSFICTERREMGGYAMFEMRFVENGAMPGVTVTADTQSQVNSASNNAQSAASASLDNQLIST